MKYILPYNPQRPDEICFKDGQTLEYVEGSFDSWLIRTDGSEVGSMTPKDVEYFELFLNFVEKYHFDRFSLYADFVAVYEQTRKRINPNVLKYIESRAPFYNEKAGNFCKLMCLFHMAMIAEENKANATLGKRIKRLGVHQVLCEGYSVEEAANFSRGKGAYKLKEGQTITLDQECRNRGF